MHGLDPWIHAGSRRRRATLSANMSETATPWKFSVEGEQGIWADERSGVSFPARFGSIQDARAHCHVFFPWYNTEHHHSRLGLLTPADVHHGAAEERIAARATGLATAYAAHPERFTAGPPQPPARPVEVWINRPKTRASEEASYSNSREPAVLFHAGSAIPCQAICECYFRVHHRAVFDVTGRAGRPSDGLGWMLRRWRTRRGTGAGVVGAAPGGAGAGEWRGFARA